MIVRAKTEGSLVPKVWAIGLLVAALIALGLMLDAKPALADATFTVTRTDDSKDPDPSDGECGVFSARGGRACSLRAAIEQANATPGADTIKFNIPGNAGGVRTISPASALPSITDPLTIDGYTQPGSEKNTQQTGATNAVILVELNGSAAGLGSDGLAIAAPNVVVRGLAINFFGSASIKTDDRAQGARIEGNFIGPDTSGTFDRGNSGRGVSIVDGGNHTIGGTTPDKRNLISGNNAIGVILRAEGGNKVQGNLIGTSKDGTSPLGNSFEGVDLISSGNTVGGAKPGEANVIAFNSKDGVQVSEQSDEDNTGNRILRNSIFANGEEGIELGGEGRTDNDPKDPDAGGNDLQNFPVVTSAKTSGGKTTIKGELDSTPSKTFTIRFFANPLGEDEGKTFLGQKSVTTGSGGKVSFTFSPSQVVPGGAKRDGHGYERRRQHVRVLQSRGGSYIPINTYVDS
jgi:CSLREA domain-containing protein